MRGICLVLALLGVPAIAAAEQPRSAQQRPVGSGSGAIGSVGLPLPSIGLPLPSIGLPLPSIGLSPREEELWRRDGYDRDRNQRGGYARGDQRDGQWGDDGQWRGGPAYPYRHQRSGPAYLYLAPPYPYYGYGVPSYGYGVTSVGVMPSTTVPGMITVVPEPLNGTLRLEVEPADILQVFVDGNYVGTPADLGSEISLPPGSRRIEFRAPGYKTLTIDAQIVSQRTIVYRAVLERLAPARVIPPPPAPIEPPAPPPPPAPSGNRTLYLIPGCYMGNVAPKDLKLPAGCDLKRLTTITP